MGAATVWSGRIIDEVMSEFSTASNFQEAGAFIKLVESHFDAAAQVSMLGFGTGFVLLIAGIALVILRRREVRDKLISGSDL